MTALVSFDRDAIRSLSPEGQREVVGQFIEQGRNMLAQAIQASDLYGIRDAKGAASTINEMTRQLGLCKEARIDAEELVRRGEYELDKAIRLGQAAGEVSSDHNAAAVRYGRLDQTSMPKPSDFFPNAQERSDAYQMGSVEPERFEEVLAEAKSEGNVSRANVVRKIKQQKSPQTRGQRADQIDDLASQGYTSEQIADRVNVSAATVRMTARDYDIDIPADRARGKRVRINSNRVLSGVAESVSAAAYSIQQVNPLDLDQEEAQEWLDSLTESISALRKATKTIKESLHVQA